MEAESPTGQITGETVRASVGILAATFKLLWAGSGYVLGVVGVVLSYVLYPVVLLIRLLAILLTPLWLIASWTFHVAVVVPAQFLSKFETLYVFMTTALIIGVTTGVILRFSTLLIVSLVPDVPESFLQEIEDGGDEEDDDGKDDELLAEQRREQRLLEALGRAEMVGRRREKERIRYSASESAAGSGGGSTGGGGVSGREEKGPPGKQSKSSGSGSNVLKETILEEESSAEWDS